LQPERLSGLEYSIRADVWSTGLSLLELVQNRFPFPCDMPPIELMIYITQSEVRISFLRRGVRYIHFLRLAAPIRRRSRCTLERCHEGLHQRDVRPFTRLPRVSFDFIPHSLRVDPALRPTPKEMSTHPWIVRVMKQEVPMERWIREVWGWPKPNRKSKDS
jgi:mitogen-activated protein kinase kinase